MIIVFVFKFLLILEIQFFKPINVIEIEHPINKIEDRTSFVEYGLTNFILEKPLG